MTIRTPNQVISDNILQGFKDSLEEELNESFNGANEELNDYRPYGEWQEEHEDDLRIRVRESR